MILKDKLGDINTVWARYSDYEIIEKNSEDFVKATESSTIQIYNVDEIGVDFLVDAINVGKMVYDKVKKYEDETLDFIRKYGLLGWMTYLPVDTYFYHEESTYLGKNKDCFENQLFLPSEEYIQFFSDVSELEGMVDIASSLGKDNAFNFVFSKPYAEPLQWTMDKLEMIYIHFVSVLNHDNDNLSEYDRAFLEKKAVGLENHGVYFHMTTNPTVKTQWEVNSLLTMLELIHALALSDEDRPLKSCKHCGDAYYNKNARSEFCSVKCRNHYNVLAYRERQREDKE